MPKQDPAIRSRAGSSLVEILVVLLLVSLAAAALMTEAGDTLTKFEPERLESDPSADEAGELARILQLWTTDPQALETLDLEGDPDLEAALDEDPPLRVLPPSEDLPPSESEEPETDTLEDDPDLRWVD